MDTQPKSPSLTPSERKELQDLVGLGAVSEATRKIERLAREWRKRAKSEAGIRAGRPRRGERASAAEKRRGIERQARQWVTETKASLGIRIGRPRHLSGGEVTLEIGRHFLIAYEFFSRMRKYPEDRARAAANACQTPALKAELIRMLDKPRVEFREFVAKARGSDDPIAFEATCRWISHLWADERGAHLSPATIASHVFRWQKFMKTFDPSRFAPR